MIKVEIDNMQNTPSRMPCRGCLRNCKNYNSCQGRPWRIAREETSPHKIVEKSLKPGNRRYN